MSSGTIPHGAAVPPPAIRELSAGIFAYVQLDGSWFLNNAGCIVGQRAATLIDTTGTEARARAWEAAVRRVTPNPVTRLVNTHHHADHTNGNFMFAREASIIGHELARGEIARWPKSLPFFPDTDFGECPKEPPTITFKDELTLWVDDLEVQLQFMGPAHTTNDVIAWIPERRLLFSGDLVFNGGTPFAMFGSLSGWQRALDRLEALGAETVVPGHGDVCGPEVFARVRAYVSFVQEAASRGFAAGATPEEVARDLDLGEFGALCDPERIVPNLYRAYSELRGEPLGTPLPLGEMFQLMIDYNGGQPLRCLA